jgi:hypothetical protein
MVKTNVMIQANELRQDNWVLKLGTPSKFDFYVEDDRTYLDEFEPIPLTPEILEKCGFDKGMGIDHKFQGLRLRLWKNNDWILLNTNGCDLYPRMPTIKYLHQLQNLYFALTGKELQVNIQTTAQ